MSAPDPQPPRRAITRTAPALLLAIFILALGVRVAATVAFVGLSSPPRASANPDQLDYELLAWHLATGQGYTLQPGTPTACRPPGTSFALLPVYAIFGRSFAVGRLWFCVLSALTCVVVAMTAWVLGGRLAGMLGGIALALYPAHFYYAMHFVSECPFGLFLSVGVLATVVALRRPALRWDVLSGAAWGLAILTRPQAIFILPPLAGVAFLARPGRRAARRPHFRRWLLQGCVLLGVVMPWVVRNAVVMGKPTLTTVGGLTFWGANNEVLLTSPALAGTWIKTSTLQQRLRRLPPGEVQGEAAAWRYGLAFLREHAGSVPYLVAMKLRRLIEPFPDTDNRGVYWSFGLTWLLVGPLMLLGALQCWRASPPTGAALLAPVIGLVLCTIVFYGSSRFRDSTAPVMVLLSVLPIAAALARRVSAGAHPTEPHRAEAGAVVGLEAPPPQAPARLITKS